MYSDKSICKNTSKEITNKFASKNNVFHSFIIPVFKMCYPLLRISSKFASKKNTKSTFQPNYNIFEIKTYTIITYSSIFRQHKQIVKSNR
jgi:hypothetical protein